MVRPSGSMHAIIVPQPTFSVDFYRDKDLSHLSVDSNKCKIQVGGIIAVWEDHVKMLFVTKPAKSAYVANREYLKPSACPHATLIT